MYYDTYTKDTLTSPRSTLSIYSKILYHQYTHLTHTNYPVTTHLTHFTQYNLVTK